MSKLLERIQDGLKGKYQGLDNGLSRANKYLFGVQRSCYYLIGGLSGTFKTTLVDFMLLRAIEDAKSKGIRIDIFYYSYEIDEYTKKLNWLSVIIFQKYNIAIPPERIKGLGDNRLSADELELVNFEIPYIEELFKTINFRYKSNNPTGIYNEMHKHFADNGKFIKETYQDHEGNTKERILSYQHNDPNVYTIVVLDHILLLKKERGFGDKEVLDKYSEYCVQLRNMFGCTFFNISQFNDGLTNVDRAKFKGIDLSPQMTDFKSTRNPYADADIVLGTMSPFKLDMENWNNYNVKKLKSKMLVLKIIKNRLSTDNIAIGLYVNAKAGSFKELPLAKDMTEEIYKKIEQDG